MPRDAARYAMRHDARFVDMIRLTRLRASADFRVIAAAVAMPIDDVDDAAAALYDVDAYDDADAHMKARAASLLCYDIDVL